MGLHALLLTREVVRAVAAPVALAASHEGKGYDAIHYTNRTKTWEDAVWVFPGGKLDWSSLYRTWASTSHLRRQYSFNKVLKRRRIYGSQLRPASMKPRHTAGWRREGHPRRQREGSCSSGTAPLFSALWLRNLQRYSMLCCWEIRDQTFYWTSIRLELATYRPARAVRPARSREHAWRPE